MNLVENLRLALEALRANMLRTLLTLLGMVVGVGAVIAVIAIARGGQAVVVQEVEGLGSGMVWVEPNWLDQPDFQRVIYLGREDLEAIARLPGVAEASPMINASMEARAGAEVRRLNAVGVSAGYQAVRNLALGDGRFISQGDVTGTTRTAVIDHDLKQRFFGDGGAVGETLWLDGRPFTVIGVLEDRAGLTAQLGGTGEELLLPYTTVQRLTGTRDILAVFVQPEPHVSVPALLEDIRTVLARRHPPNRFMINSLDQVLDAVRSVTDVMTLVVAGIAAIALVVGGIGIMNIMLVSVTERTREIGLRKAIGARWSDIMQQFLIEAVVVSSLGGLIGIVLSAGLITLVSRFTALPSLVSPGSILIGFGFSALVGVVFGVYPASKAARMDPIQALRFE